MGKLLKTVLTLAARVMGAESASLLLLDNAAQELYFHTALDLGDKVSGVRLKLGQGIAGSVARDRKPAIINDARKDPRWSPAMDASTGFTTRSILAMPLVFKGRLIGVVEAINKKVGDFTAEDLDAFEAFASQASVAIENARLFSSLREEKLKLDTVVSEMTDGVILADGSGKIVLANESARKLLGRAAPPRALSDGFAPFKLTPALDELFGGDGRTQDFVAEREEPKKLVLSGKLGRLESGRLCVFRDVTDEWNKERIKRTFLSLISHKLKTPLAAVIGFADLLTDELKELKAPPTALKASATILSQGRKLGELVDKLLRYVTIQDPESTVRLEKNGVDDLVGDALKMMGPWLLERGGSVEYSGAPGASLVCDRDRLIEVVRNLVENAVKFDDKPQRRVYVRAESRRGWVALSVEDTGRGIPPEDREKVFSQFHQIETFFTGQVDGWGLGLPYVKKVVENHGGQVLLESALGKGTTVTVTLPEKPGGAA